MADLRRLAQRAVAKLYHDSFIHGRLGRLNSDGSYTIRVPDRPAYAYVQMASEGGQTIAIARNPGVSLQANLPVRMRDHNGDLVIEGVDFDKLAMVESSDPSGPPAAGVQVHHHRIGSGLEYEYDPRLFEAGRVYHASAMAVYINPFRYQKPDGTFEHWPGGALNISSHQPATSGEHAWVLIGIDPSDNTATAAAGTAKADTSDLTIAELDDIAFAGKIPCGAVRVREDDGDLSDLSKYVDAHGWFNQTLNQLRSLTGNLGVYVADGGNVKVGGATTNSRSTDSDAVLLVDTVGKGAAHIWRNSDDIFGPDLILGKTRGTAIGSNDIVASGDRLGIIKWYGGDGGSTTPTEAARIAAIVEGTPANTDIRAYIQFVTRGSDGFAERAKIDSSGNMAIGNTITPSNRLHIVGDAPANSYMRIANTDGTAVTAIFGTNGTTAESFFGTLSNHPFVMRTNNTERARLNNTHFNLSVGLGEAWNAPSFNTGWGNAGGVYETAGYRRFGDMVMLKGNVSRSSGTNTTIFTLPAAYRPSNAVIFAAPRTVSPTDPSIVRILSTGEVEDFDSLGAAGLDGIWFYAP